MIEESGKDSAVALATQGGGVRRVEQGARLVVANGWRFTFLAFHFRTLDALDRIACNGVDLAQVIKQRRERGQLAPNRWAGQLTVLQVAALGEDVSAGNNAELFRTIDAGKHHELLQVALIGTAGLRIVDVGVPGHRWRHISQLIELLVRQVPA